MKYRVIHDFIYRPDIKFNIGDEFDPEKVIRESVQRLLNDSRGALIEVVKLPTRQRLSPPAKAEKVTADSSKEEKPKNTLKRSPSIPRVSPKPKND